MQQEQMMLYLRENIVIVSAAAGGVALLIWVSILFQVTRTRREVHKICKKIRRYFDVIMADDTQEAEPVQEEKAEDLQVPVYEVSKEAAAQNPGKSEEDVKLLMDVISEVF